MDKETVLHVNGAREELPVFSPPLRTLAQVISYLLHPLFIPVIVTFLTVQALPEYFVSFKQSSLRFSYDILYFRVIMISVLFPLLTIMLAKALRFIDSIYLRSQRDRIIPYVASIIYYFWAFYSFKRQGVSPAFFNAFLLGVFLAVIISFIANIFVKISMHTTGWGGVIGLLLALMFGMHMNVTVALVITVFVAALVATARMILSAHTPADVYAGFLVGILSQLVAYAIVG